MRLKSLALFHGLARRVDRGSWEYLGK